MVLYDELWVQYHVGGGKGCLTQLSAAWPPWLGHAVILEYGDKFKWPARYGECPGSHCDIGDNMIPLLWQNVISENPKSSIHKYTAGDGFSFKEAFVVKTIRGTDSQKDREQTAEEVKSMKDLRHPHIAVLLGTFTFHARLSILDLPGRRMRSATIHETNICQFRKQLDCTRFRCY